MFYRLFILVCLLLHSYAGVAQRPFNDKFWLFEAVSDVKIYAMVQDERGYMWLGTDMGLCKFTGQGFFPIHDTIHKAVTSLYNDKGTIYAGYENGMLGRVYGDTMHFIKIRNAAPATAVRDLIATTSEAFLGTDDGLYVVMGGSGARIDKRHGLPGNAVSSIMHSGPGKLLVGTGNGLCELRINGGKISVTAYAPALVLPGNSIRILKRAAGARQAWAGTSAGIARIPLDGDLRPITVYRKKWLWGSVNDILVLDEHKIWVATATGYLLDVTVYADSLVIKPYLFRDNIYTRLLYNNSGNMWCATANALSVLSIGFAENIHLSSPFDITLLTAMACDSRNMLWLAQGKELYCTQLAKDTLKPRLAGRLPGNITCLYIDKNSGLWVGTATHGLWYKTAGSGFKRVQVTSPAIGNEIESISSDASGHLWVADGSGIKELEIWDETARVVKVHNHAGGLPAEMVTYLFKDSSGNMWIATDKGICMYDGKEYHYWDSASGLTSTSIVTIAQDIYGNIWAGSADNGVFRYAKGKWVHLSKVNGLQDMSISTVATNGTGQVVLVNGKGVDQWYPESVQFRRFNSRSSPSIDSTLMIPNCSATDTDGNVYIPTESGLIVFTNIKRPLVIKPAIYINKVGVFLKPVKPGTTEFTHDQHHISFQYEGINFANIEPLFYRYFLEGYSDEWTFSVNETISFPQLAPGKYKFRLQASLDKDFEEASEVTYSFSISPPFWMRPWFIILAAMLLAGAFYWYVRFREKRLKNVAQLKQDRALFEYEHLKSQVDPHFLFNSLNTLTNLIDEDKEHAIDYTVELSALYRNILTYRNKDTIYLREECKLLSSYMHIQKRRFRHGLALESDIPEKVLQGSKIVPLALQLLVENAIKHNVVSMSHPLTIYISVSEDDMLVVRNRIATKISKEKGAGLALQNIQKRYSLMTKKEVSYGEVNGEYIVKLPLL